MLLIVVIMLITALASCTDGASDELSDMPISDLSDSSTQANNTLKVGFSGFSYVFNPFFATDCNDLDVVDVTSLRLLTFDNDGLLVEDAINGKTVNEGEISYKYSGISKVDVSISDKGEVTYSFKLRENVKFSDGETLNADDAVFTMYVLCDNSYDGAVGFGRLPICGINDYRNNKTPFISGIKKTGDYSFDIKLDYYCNNVFDALNFVVAPLHYYGNDSMYDYEKNMFGFTKGDISSIKSNNIPFGAGPYAYDKYDDGTISFVSNEYFYKAKPEIENLKFITTEQKNMIAETVNGKLDICFPDYNIDNVNSISNINKGDVQGDILYSYTYENNGYGYIGINANNVSVSNDASSEASKNLRKAFATLFSYYREQSITDYFGEGSKVIQCPPSIFSNDKNDSTIFNSDISGKDIYDNCTSDTEKLNAVMDAVKGYLIGAGYEFDSSRGVFFASPEGASLEYIVTLFGNGKGDHPCYKIFTNAKNALNGIGITLNINDASNITELCENINSGNADIWAAAWNMPIIPPLYQMYHSSNISNSFNGSTATNIYRINDALLDEHIITFGISDDASAMEDVYYNCRDIINDWAVEIPVYNISKFMLFNSEEIDISTISMNYSDNWDWVNDIFNIAFKK